MNAKTLLIPFAAMLIALAACAPTKPADAPKNFGEAEAKAPLLDWKQDADLSEILKQFPEIEGYEKDLLADKTRDDSRALAGCFLQAWNLAAGDADDHLISRVMPFASQTKFTPQEADRILELSKDFASSCKELTAHGPIVIAEAPIRAELHEPDYVGYMLRWAGLIELRLACLAANGDLGGVVVETHTALLMIRGIQTGSQMVVSFTSKTILAQWLRCLGRIAARADDPKPLAAVLGEFDFSTNLRECYLRTTVVLVADARENLRKHLPQPTEEMFAKWQHDRDQFKDDIKKHRVALAGKLPGEAISSSPPEKLVAAASSVSLKGDEFESPLAAMALAIVKANIELESKRDLAAYTVACKSKSKEDALKDLQAALKPCGLIAVVDGANVRVEPAADGAIAKSDLVKGTPPYSETKEFTPELQPVPKPG